MIDVFVLDGDLKIIGIIDAYKSLIWAKRYRETGDCELYIPEIGRASCRERVL